MKRRGLLLFLGALVCASSGPLGCASTGGAEEPQTRPTCQGLSCQVARCAAGSDTVLRGVVAAPNGRDPIRQALVYVPENTGDRLPPLPEGLSCELCQNTLFGRAVTFAYTGLDGRFELRGVPAGDSVPIVIQKGRFRRLLHLPVQACKVQDASVANATLALPKNRREGDMPQIAVAAGDHDAIECVLRELGIDPSEFGAGDGSAAVHLYDNQTPGTPSLPGQLGLPLLLSDKARLNRYHMLFLNCSSTAYSQTLLASAEVRANLQGYIAAGGRLYATDWSYDFVQQIPEFAPFICFEDGEDCKNTMPHRFHGAVAHGGDSDPLSAAVDQSSPSGRALAAWLEALPTPVPASRIPIQDLLPGWVMIAQPALDMDRYPSTVWLSAQAKGRRRPLTMTFDYPPQVMCGRVLFSSYHTRERLNRQLFPAYCPLPGDGVPVQERILEFLLFELSDCLGTVG